MQIKIVLVTIFDNVNFGTYLQALATSVKLQQLGADVKILWYERPWNRLKTPFDQYIPLIRRFGLAYARLRGLKGYLQKHECREFVKKYVPITKLYYTYEELLKNPPKADVYLTGSDQVWNTFHNKGIQPVYYLDFVHNVKKVAYAASIGQNEIEDQYKTRTKELLSEYKAISVRESSAINLLNDIDIKAETVLDPTLLLDRNEWENLVSPYKNDKPYVLVYSVEFGGRDEIISKTARLVANSINGEVIEVNYVGSRKCIPNCDKRFSYATPDIFLSLMLGASFCVVSSFHGTAFSLNLNIPFITVTPEAFSSRIDNILRATGTEERKISEFDDENVIDLINSPIDFDKVNAFLSYERVKSEIFIKGKILN